MAFIMLRYLPSMPDFWRVFYHKCMWNFVKSFLCIYWNNHMVFIFQLVNVVYHIDWFAKVLESLHAWDKDHLFMMYIFDVVGFSLLEFCWGFLHLCSSVILACSFLFLWHLCQVLVLGWWWPHRMSLEVYLPLQFS